MEKKTIGKFISVLRRASGMTQRELAEKLFVSDKSVSRWECDECTPDLALIPVIAELFGVTSDELLRGERRNAEKNDGEGGRYALKSEKQFKKLLDARLKKYGNLTLISLGLAILGWLMGVLCNFAFYNGVLGFVLAAVFFLASEIGQVCFARSMRIPFDEEEGYHVRVEEANSRMVKSLVWISILNLGLFAFSFPMAFTGGVGGLSFMTWIGMGGIFAAVMLAVTYVVYTLCIHPSLVKRGYLSETAGDEQRRRNVKRMGKVGSAVTIIALLICGGVLAVNMIGVQAFINHEYISDAQAFKQRMESDFDRVHEEGWSYETINGIHLNPPSVGDAERYKRYGVIYDTEGEKIEFYYNEDLYEEIVYSYDGAGNPRAPVAILTVESYHRAYINFEGLQTILWWLLPVDIVGGVIVYVILWAKDKGKK